MRARGNWILGLCLVLALAGCAGKKEAAPAQGGDLDPDEARVIARDAYLYGYPLVTMELTRRVMTNAAEPGPGRAPVNQFSHIRRFVTAGHREVTTPNADTLYSTAWLDLSAGPVVLTLPEAKGRYYLMQIMSAWTDVLAAPGSRTSGTGPQAWAITGPGWKGGLPAGVKEIRSPTNLVWILGRTYCTGEAPDYEAVHALQDKYGLVPLSSWGRPYAPPAGAVDPKVDMQTPVRDQVNALPAGAFFRLLSRLLVQNPPGPEDAPMLARMARLGLVPGQDFDLNRMPPEIALAVAGAPRAGLARIATLANSAAQVVNGWSLDLNMGTYGADYERRAMTAYTALGANLPLDAVYAMSVGWLSGQARYVLRFPKGLLPPVNAFWSLSVYDDQRFFVDNPLNRYSLSSRDPLRLGEDGSVTLYIQHESPGPGKEANWLPAPAGNLNLVLRLYWPKLSSPSVLDGSWTPPELELAQ